MTAVRNTSAGMSGVECKDRSTMTPDWFESAKDRPFPAKNSPKLARHEERYVDGQDEHREKVAQVGSIYPFGCEGSRHMLNLLEPFEWPVNPRYNVKGHGSCVGATYDLSVPRLGRLTDACGEEGPGGPCFSLGVFAGE